MGNRIKILSMPNNSYVVVSKDSLKMIYFDACGHIVWQKQFNIPNMTASLSDVIALSNGGILLLTRIDNNGFPSSLISKIDNSGNLLWSKSYTGNQLEQYPYSILEDLNGNIFLFANTVNTISNNPFNILLKLDANGNPLWTKFYNYGWVWGAAIVTNDNGLLLRAGNTFIKTNFNGDAEWAKSFTSASTYYYPPAIEVSDGYIFTKNANSGLSELVFYKVDKQGNLMWNGYKQTNIIGISPVLKKLGNNNFALVFNSNNTGTQAANYVEFDKDLNVIMQKAFSNTSANIVVQELCNADASKMIWTGLNTNNNDLVLLSWDLLETHECEVASNPINITQGLVIEYPSNVIVINETLVSQDHQFTFNNIQLQETTLCADNKAINLGNDTAICISSVINLLSYQFDSYLWSTGDTSASITIDQAGIYTLIAKENCNDQVWFDEITITELPSVKPQLGADKVLCEGQELELKATPCSSCNYLWNNGNVNNSISVKQEGDYWVQLDNKNGCVYTDTISIKQNKCDCNIYLPSAFTPNEDGLNEIFKAQYFCDITQFQMLIFNRWGETIFETTNPEKGWDGKVKGQRAPQEVYSYIINYFAKVNGIVSEPYRINGAVTVIY